MKKIFTLVAVLCAAMAINAQDAEPVVLSVENTCNWLDVQRDCQNILATNPTSTAYLTSINGFEFRGYAKADGSEAECKWNTKDTYNTVMPLLNVEGVDSLRVGSMFRAGSGCAIAFPVVDLAADAHINIYFQPNGDSERGLELYIAGNEAPIATKTGEGTKINGTRPAYRLEATIPAGYYMAGDIVVKIITNTSNVFGIEADQDLVITGIANTVITTKAQKVIENGQIYIIRDGMKFNVLGAQVK